MSKLDMEEYLCITLWLGPSVLVGLNDNDVMTLHIVCTCNESDVWCKDLICCLLLNIL
jgi:hypothetical protein